MSNIIFSHQIDFWVAKTGLQRIASAFVTPQTVGTPNNLAK
jgi:hypothetical protein